MGTPTKTDAKPLWLIIFERTSFERAAFSAGIGYLKTARAVGDHPGLAGWSVLPVIALASLWNAS